MEERSETRVQTAAGTAGDASRECRSHESQGLEKDPHLDQDNEPGEPRAASRSADTAQKERRG